MSSTGEALAATVLNLPRHRGCRTAAGPAPAARIDPLEPRLLLDSLVGAAVWADEACTEPGLTGSYVDADLSGSAEADWRLTQAIAGTRVDDPVEFLSDGWGWRDEVGLTGGSDDNWEQFSVQWDGWLEVTQAGQRFATVSDDGSRMWIDLDQDGLFEDDERTDNGWGRGQGMTTGDRTAGVSAGVYAIRIQYCEMGGGNAFSLASSPYVPPPFVPTPTNPRQVVRVVVLSFDPRVPSEGNQFMHEVFGWTDPRSLAQQFERDLEWATGGAVDVQVVEWRDLDAFPTFTDGFRYNPDEYVANRRSNSGWHSTGTDYYELIESQGLLEPINAGEFDEIWTFGDHYFSLLGEAWMGGPNSFFINGPSFPDAGFDRAIAGYGFSYERGVAEMIHDLAHRTENHGQRAFGSWNLYEPATAWDQFSANYLETGAGPYGVGTCHVPANADDHYDYGDERTVESIAPLFWNYPDLDGDPVTVGRDTWAVGPAADYHRDYMDWYFASMPRNDGTDADGRMANWYKYIWDFNSYEDQTGLPREEDAFGAGPIVRDAGAASYDLTVRYYDGTGIDTSTLDGGDVRVLTPGGATLAATLVSAGTETPTTAGTARTATYRITPPGGAWDPLDNGNYRIVLQAGQVRDTGGAYVPDGEIGSFRVAMPDPAVINVAGMLGAGEVSAAHTTFDIGTVGNLFDGNTSTLVRTPNIDPAVVTLTFDAPQTVTGFRAFFAGAWGDPAYQYTIEAADTQADLDAHAGSYRLLVPQTGTPSEVYSSVTLAAPQTARLFRLTATRLTGDDYVHINEWQLVGTGTAETGAPVAALEPVAEAQLAQTVQFLTVTFTDATAVDATSLNSGDLRVVGPGGWTVEPTFYDVDDYTDGAVRTATYWFIPPDGSWSHHDNGRYTIELRAGSAKDVFGNACAAAVLGTFDVQIDPPQHRPPADMAEQNAADWSAWADGASASVSDNGTFKIAGEASILFDTDGGFDTYARYGGPGLADWDLSAATTLTFSLYADNPSPYDFQEGPWVRLNGTDGGYFEYRYFENDWQATPINQAVGQWQTFAIPLEGTTAPTGWRRMVSGAPSLEHIASVEFHADTWDHGFLYWLDEVGFDLPAATVAGRHVFYNGSQLDGNDSAANAADDGAIAGGVQALPVGQASAGCHTSGYARGLNGVMIDIAWLGGTPTEEDFSFRFGGAPGGGAWSDAPAPSSISVRRGAGVDGSDRVTLIWPDGQLHDGWLEITVLPGDRTGLAEPDVFCFAHIAGDADGSGAVDLADLAILATHWNAPGAPSAGDFTGDGLVDLADLAILATNWNQAVAAPVAQAAASAGRQGARRPASQAVVNPTPAPRVAARPTNELLDERPVDLLAPVVPNVRARL